MNDSQTISDKDAIWKINKIAQEIYNDDSHIEIDGNCVMIAHKGNPNTSCIDSEKYLTWKMPENFSDLRPLLKEISLFLREEYTVYWKRSCEDNEDSYELNEAMEYLYENIRGI